jgi:multiple sugar transport system ATP-binding protein
MSGLTLSNVSKSFGSTTAVDGIDLDIGANEFVSILGPSGCGKTTLLRMLAGLEQPDSGEISIAGKVVNDLPPSRRDIAMVFQTYALYPHMTVAGNIEYPLRKRGLSKAARQEKLKHAAELLQLGELLQRKPRELSGGQQQRVALGRAMVRDPQVFLLDEPLSNLDAKLRAHMRAELIRLQRRIGRTMVYVTHDQLEAMTMSDRIAVIRNGRLQQFAPPQEVYDKPANEFVAGFIGTPPMKFIDGKLAADGSFRHSELRLDLGALQLTPDFRPAADGTPVRLGIRPEALCFDDDGQSARVTVIEPVGHELIVMLDFFGVELTARVAPNCEWSVDDDVKLRPVIDQLHIFDPDDGRRLNAK